MMDSFNVYVSWDGDSIGQRVGRATLADDVEEVRKVDQAIQAGNEVWRGWALSHGGSVVEIGGDEGRIQVPADALDELPGVCETYKTAVDATVSVGVGKKLSESAKALLAAKIRGKNRVVLYSKTVEEELARVEDKPEEKKVAEEYLDEPANGAPTAELFEKAEGEGKGVTHAKAPNRQRVDHEEGEVAKDGAKKPIVPETSADVRDHLARAHGAAGAQEKKDRAAQASRSGDLAALRGQVGNALQAMQKQLPVMANLKSAYPDTYQAVVGLVQAVVKMGQELQQADSQLAKAAGDDDGDEDPEPAPLAKFQDTIEFPKLGVERRPDTPVVHNNLQHATRQGLIGATNRYRFIEQRKGTRTPEQLAQPLEAHRASTRKEMTTTLKRRTAAIGPRGMAAGPQGGARPSFAISSALMARSKGKNKSLADSNFHPKAEDATVIHENFHHLVNRIDEKYGVGAGRHAIGWLVRQVPSKEHLSLMLNFATRHYKYKTSNPDIYEETVALLHNYLNNPATRSAFLGNRRSVHELGLGKRMSDAEAQTFGRGIDQMMKQSYHSIRRAAAAMTPEQLKEIIAKRTGHVGWTKAELEEAGVEKGLLSETEDETGAPPAPPLLDKGTLPTHAPERMVWPSPSGPSTTARSRSSTPTAPRAGRASAPA